MLGSAGVWGVDGVVCRSVATWGCWGADACNFTSAGCSELNVLSTAR